MTTGIKFDRQRAKDFVQDWDLWPMADRPENARAQEWWIGVMRPVLWAVNERDWNEEAYPEDRYTEIVESVVDEQVAQARKERFVMTLCELSEVDKVITDPFDDGVYARMTGTVVELSHQGLYGHPGEDPDKADLRHKRHEEVAKRLALGAVAETYLEAAADQVARGWCELLVEQWREANPEDDEDEDE